MGGKSKQDRHKRFLLAGFFAPELPPPFDTRDWASRRGALERAFTAAQAFPGGIKADQYASIPERLSIPRFGRNDRKIAIINPINYFFISQLLSEHWKDLKPLIKSPYSISQPIFDWAGQTVFVKPDFNRRNESLSALSIKYRYILYSDIARFYHSIYTHSIPWAIHGKAVAKAHQRSNIWGNRLDKLVRNAQDRQTIGIPVGPETSRVLAELVACGVDRELRTQYSDSAAETLRFVDDFAIGANSIDETERLKAALRRALHAFELEINEEKTFPEEVHHLNYASWRQEIRRQVPTSSAKPPEWQRFFDAVMHIAAQNPKENVELYALKRSREGMVFSSDWPVMESHLLVIYRFNNTLLPIICSIVINRNALRQDVNLKRMKDFIATNLRRLTENDKALEISWMLFLAKALKIRLHKKDVEAITLLENSVCALLLCDLERLGLVPKLNKGKWNQYANLDGLRSHMWLYAYESCRLGWNGLTLKYPNRDIYFAELLKRNIAFYNLDKNVLQISSQKRIDLANALRRQKAFRESLIEIDDPERSFPTASFDDYDDYTDGGFY